MERKSAYETQSQRNCCKNNGTDLTGQHLYPVQSAESANCHCADLCSRMVELIFVPVVALNTIIGIAQELKAKRLIEKLTLLSQSNAKIERNGELRSVPIAEVQEQDILLLESGNQICADAVVTDGGIEVNESLLTGESDAVYKKGRRFPAVRQFCYQRHLPCHCPPCGQ